MSSAVVFSQVIVAFVPTLVLVKYYSEPGMREWLWVARVGILVMPGVACCAVVAVCALKGAWSTMPAFAYSAGVYFWLWWKGGGGDSTKRKLRKLGSKIAIKGSRLVAVPTPA